MKFIDIPEGIYEVGNRFSEGHCEDLERDIINFQTQSFQIQSTQVTNEEFQEFVSQTNYITEAEERGTSYVFKKHLSDQKGLELLPWWSDVKGASWKTPYGPNSSIEGKAKHPVVHVSYKDAIAYCDHFGFRLPTEIEWEIAARGGLKQEKYSWGSTKPTINDCNIWFGEFPHHNETECGTREVASYAPNGYGIYDTSGNVWEWCLNRGHLSLNELKEIHENIVFRKYEHHNFIAARGGSYLCHASYCDRYRVAARNNLDRYTSSSNLGFRCLKAKEAR